MAQRKIVCNYLIVGGGPVGSSVAYHLSKMGAKHVVVLEKDLCFRSASAMLSAGGIRQQFSVPENIKMSMYGAEFIKNPSALSVNGEVPDLQFHENGYLFLSGERSKHVLEANYKTQRECGADWMTLMDGSALSKRFGWLQGEDLALGSFGEKNEGYFDPWMFVSALKQKNASMGVEYIEADILSAVMVPAVSGGGDHVIDEISFRRRGQAEVDKIHATEVVNCAGAWSGRLLHLLSRSLHRPQAIAPLPVAPRKRCIFAFNCRPSDRMPPVKTPLTIDPSGVYFRPEGLAAGRFIAGVSPAEEHDRDVPEGREAEELGNVDQALFEEVIWPVLCERVPAFAELRVTASWAGFYDYNTVDQNAIIGAHSDVRNLTLATGFSGHGLQQSPAAGRAVAELLTRSPHSIDLSRLSFERIVDNRPIFETGIV